VPEPLSLPLSLALTTGVSLLVSLWIWLQFPTLINDEAGLRLLRGVESNNRPSGLVTVTLTSVGVVVSWIAGFLVPINLGRSVADGFVLVAMGLLAGATGWLYWIDSSIRRLPNRIVLPLAGASLLLYLACLVVGALLPQEPNTGWAGHATPAINGLIGALLLLIFFVLVNLGGALVHHTGIGMGDVKLAVPVGLAVSVDSLWGLLVALIAMNLSACLQLFNVYALKRSRLPNGIAYGPHMLIGAWVAIIITPLVL